MAGLGLFFIGIRLISINLRLLTGTKFRMFLQKLTNKAWIASLIGILAGAITQSTSAVTFIMTGMIQAGLVSTRRAMPLVLWSNVGNSILVFLAVINFHTLILYSLGLVGLLYYLDIDKTKLLKPLVGGLLGAGLLFLGLDFIKQNAENLGHFPFIEILILETKDGYIWGLLIAGVSAFFIQSAATVTAIAIALTTSGLLSLESTLMMVYGSNLGPAVSTWLLAAKLTGGAKRLAVFQVIFKFFGLLLFTSLFYIEIYYQVPLVIALLKQLSNNLPTQMAYAYLSFQIITAILLSFTIPLLNKFLSKKHPESLEDTLSKPKYMRDDVLKEPEVAIALLEREQLRVVKRFPNYLDSLRPHTLSPQGWSPRVLHAGTGVLCREIENYFHELLKQSLSRELVEKTLNLQNRMEILLNLEETLYEIVNTIKNTSDPLPLYLETFKQDVLESTTTLLHTLLDVIKDKSQEDIKILRQLTEDRGDLLPKIHNDIRSSHPNLTIEEQQLFDTLSSRFERIVWMLRYLNKIIDSPHRS